MLAIDLNQLASCREGLLRAKSRTEEIMDATAPPGAAVRPQESRKEKKGRRSWATYALVVGVLIGASLFFIPPPQGVNPNGWHLLGLLIPLVVVWATESIPVGVGAAVFLSVVVGFRLSTADVAFKGFTSQLPWLLVGAFLFGVAMEQCGLSKRMAYWLISRLRGVWGLITAAYASNIFLMGVPSSNARAAILAPVLNAIMTSLGRPTDSQLSRLLTFNFINATVNLLSVLFLTGGAANVVALALYTELTGATVTWTQWVVIMFIPTLIMMGVTFGASLIFARPEPELVEKLRDVSAAREAYAALGPTTAAEWKVAVLFVIVVLLWVFSSQIHWEVGFSALFVSGLLFLPGIGVLKPGALRQVNWDVVLMIGAATGIAGILQGTGMTQIVSNAVVGPILNPLSAYGLAGIAIGTIIVGLIAHFLLASPANLALALPLLIGWATKTMHMPAGQIMAFVFLLSTIGNLMVALAYQMPPFYVFLGLDVTDRPHFNALLLKIYPFAAVGMFVSAFAIYGVANLVGL
jgi:divalent anion:Na+ symporter, DASS family